MLTILIKTKTFTPFASARHPLHIFPVLMSVFLIVEHLTRLLVMYFLPHLQTHDSTVSRLSARFNNSDLTWKSLVGDTPNFDRYNVLHECNWYSVMFGIIWTTQRNWYNDLNLTSSRLKGNTDPKAILQILKPQILVVFSTRLLYFVKLFMGLSRFFKMPGACRALSIFFSTELKNVQLWVKPQRSSLSLFSRLTNHRGGGRD